MDGGNRQFESDSHYPSTVSPGKLVSPVGAWLEMLSWTVAFSFVFSPCF